jgi:hypothetical protein
MLSMSRRTEDSVLRHGLLDAATRFIHQSFKMGDLAANTQGVCRGETAGR